MQYYYNGYISLIGQQKIPDDAWAVFEDELAPPDLFYGRTSIEDAVFPEDARDLTPIQHLDAWVEFSEYMRGDLSTELDHIVKRLVELGYQPDGEISYTGDYNGGYLIEDGRVLEKDEDAWVILHASTTDLIKELRRRGYQVCGPEDHKTCMEEDDLT